MKAIPIREKVVTIRKVMTHYISEAKGKKLQKKGTVSFQEDGVIHILKIKHASVKVLSKIEKYKAKIKELKKLIPKK